MIPIIYSLLFVLVISELNPGFGIEKCIYWKERMRVSCGFIYLDDKHDHKSYATIEMYYSNRKIFESFDKICNTCVFENELIMLLKNHRYKFEYIGNKMVIKGLTDKEEEYKSEQDIDCYMCVLKLYR